MSPIDTTPMRSQTNGPGAKAQDVVGQAREFGREVKDQATELTKSATDAVKTQAANLTESAKDVAADAGERLRASVLEQKNAGADYVGNVASIIRRTAYEFDYRYPAGGVTTSVRLRPSSRTSPSPCATATCRRSWATSRISPASSQPRSLVRRCYLASLPFDS